MVKKLRKARNIHAAAVTRTVSRDGRFDYAGKHYRALGVTLPRPGRFVVGRRPSGVVFLMRGTKHVADAVEIQAPDAMVPEPFRWKLSAPGNLPPRDRTDQGEDGNEWDTSHDCEIIVHGQIRIGWLYEVGKVSEVLALLLGEEIRDTVDGCLWWDRDLSTFVPVTHWRLVGELPDTTKGESIENPKTAA